MIRARLSNGAFLFGVDAENIKRLKAGMPLVIELSPMGGSDTVLIMYGETMGDIMAELEKVSGQKLPPVGVVAPDSGPAH